MTTYILPIEPLVERYTESWYNNIPSLFDGDVVTIDGETLQDTVVVGTFLDINSTSHYKNSQMRTVARMFNDGKIKSGDVFWISDLEFWGIEALRLLADMNKVSIKIFAFLHAASYTREDAFAIAAPYQKFTEVGWVAMCDAVFVGSYYHKKAFCQRRLYLLPQAEYTSLMSKIIVSGNPLFAQDYPVINVERKNQIVISNRFDSEKRPMDSLSLALTYKREVDPSVNIIVTTSRKTFTSNDPKLVARAKQLESQGLITIYEAQTKLQYYTHLAESKAMITNSIEEMFGYCPVEAMIYGCAPVMPATCSHPELVLQKTKYLFDPDDFSDQMNTLRAVTQSDNSEDLKECTTYHFSANSVLRLKMEEVCNS